MRLAAIVVLALLASATVAEAQGCAPGRVATLEGYCCWPAQTWSDERQRCEGPPSCPSGMAAEGDDCVGVAPAPVAPPQTDPSSTSVATPPSYGGWAPAPPSPPPQSWAPAPPVWTAPPPPAPLDLSSALAGTEWPESALAPGASNARREPQLDGALFGWGMALLGAGWALSIGEAVVAFESRGIYTGTLYAWGSDYDYDASCHDAAGALFLVPVLGALLGSITHAACGVPVYVQHIGVSFRTDERRGPSGEAGYVVFGALSTALQLTGGIMALVALTVPRSVTVFDPAPSTRVSLTPHASPTSAGLALRVDWL